ncbi:MAG: ferrochelatase [Gammaproteobacteria bacterium]|nr:ferrochelatase [Gammaproteobacteria bacterium]
MPKFVGEENYSHGSDEAMGVLIVNLGTPDAPTAKAVRRYLGEFLWDPRVVEIPRPIWWLILNGFVLTTRPAKSAEAYKRVWTEEGSPLLSISKKQTDALRIKLESEFSGSVNVELGMRYGNPSLASALENLRAKKSRRILVLPLYPQYSATTTGTVFDEVANVLKKWRWLPEMRFVNQYHDDSAYIECLVNSIKEAWEKHEQPEILLFSFHGMPKQFLLEGDPYHCYCQNTARLVAKKLNLKKEQWLLSFQSLFGKAEWLKPYTQNTLVEWGRSGVKSVDVVCPGFSADCLETLEEIAILNQEFFVDAGGKTLNYIPALNDRADHIDMLANVVKRHTQGWPETDSVQDNTKMKTEKEAQRQLALDMGAGQ